jgi:amino acid adenylation domain-containing protein
MDGIEARLLRLSAERRAALLARLNRRDGSGETRLVAYVVPRKGEPLDPAEVRAYLAEHLPGSMLPGDIVVLDALPTTATGKIDRRALPRPSRALSSITGPRSATEELVAAIWSGLLERRDIPSDADFFALGGHSLMAMRVLARVRGVFGVELPVRSLFEAPTVGRLAARIDAALRPEGALPSIAPVPRDAELPLSFAEQRMWFLDRLSPGQAAYNIPCAVRMQGQLDLDALKRALDALVARHEALRTIYVERDGDTTRQILPAWSLALEIEDARVAGERLPAQLERATTEARLPFDLDAGPPVRARLVRYGDDDHLLLLTLHHIVADGWSLGVIVRDFTDVYAAYARGETPALTPLAVQYADFAAWQRRDGISAPSLAYWREKLSGAPDGLALPTDRPRKAAATAVGNRVAFLLPRPLAEQLEEFARGEGATLFMVLLAGFSALLSRYAGQTDLVIGTPIAGRSRTELEGIVGLFVNTLALRCDLAGDPDFRTLVERTRTLALDAYAHQDTPFEQIVADLQPTRDLGRTPIFQVMLELHNEPTTALALPELTLTPLDAHTGAAKFDLSLALTRTPAGLASQLEYRTDLFAPETATRLVDHLTRLLAAAVENPARPLSRIDLRGEEERQALAAVNATDRDLGPVTCIHHRISAQARRTPEAIAVEFEDEALSYRELETRTNQLAHHLRRQGVGPEALVGVCAERSLELVVALLGVLKAGAAYVPLDPELPPDRLRMMAEDAGVEVVLTQARHTGRIVAPVIVRLDADWDTVARESVEPLADGAALDNLAYVIFTSGSTGRPKGAMNTHAGIDNRLRWMQAAYQLGPDDRVLQKTPYSFDVSVWEFFWPLIAGARLIVARPGGRQDPAYLVDVIERRGITTLHFVPSMLQAFLDAPDISRCTSLKRVICSGEALTPELQARALSRLPAALYNLYGPTEAAIDVSHWTCTVEPERTTVPIGTPIANIRLYVVDRHFQQQPIGVPGELCIAGVGLGRGYFGRPDWTAERFVPDPLDAGGRMYRTGDLARVLADGAIEYLGRLDFQVKIRGVRIELGEIEAALTAHPGVKAAAVAVSPGPGGEPRLCAYTVGDVSAATLRAFLVARLPAALVPAAFVELPALPQTSSGKLDRKALPAPEFAGIRATTHVAPRTPLEAELAAIWAELLEVPEIGVHDNFFELGGHSLVAIRVIARLRKARGVELPVQAFFETPTVEGVARRVADLTAGPLASADTLMLLGEPLGREPERPSYPLSPYQLPELYMQELSPDNPYYNVSNSDMVITGDFEPEVFVQAWQTLLERHEALRTVYGYDDGEPVQRILPPARLRVEDIVIDRRDLAEADVEPELFRLIERFGATIFDFANGPMFVLRLVALPDRRHLMVFVTHHILWDEHCTILIARELSTLYNAYRAGLPDPLKPLRFRYIDYSAWITRALAAGRLEEHRRYWMNKLSPMPPVLDLPTDRDRPAIQTYNGATVAETVPAKIFHRIGPFLAERQVTLYMFLLAVLDLHMHRLTGQQDFVIGTPIANRNDEELEGVIGCFATALPMRCTIRAGMSFSELLDHARTTALEAYDHHAYPSILAIQELAPSFDPSRSRLFSVMYGLQNNKTKLMDEVRFAGAELSFLRHVPSPEFDRAKFDFSLVVDQFGEDIWIQWTHNTDLFDRSTIERWIAQFIGLIDQVIADPDRQLIDYDVLTPGDAERIASEFSAQAPLAADDGCIHEVIAETARRVPEATALVWDQGRCSYAELWTAAEAWTRHLRAAGVGPEDRVGVSLPPSPGLPAALLGILAAGAAYVPMSADQPPRRRADMLAAAGARWLITDEDPPAGYAGTVLRSAAIDVPASDPPAVDPRQLAYVLFTSGSTGTPKGIEIEHRGLVHVIASTQRDYQLGPDDAVLLATSITFDASVLDLYWSLASGARLVVPPAAAVRHPEQLAAVIDRHAVTVIQCVPTMLEALLTVRAAAPSTMESLRLVICGGSFLSRALAERFVRAFPRCTLSNHYGPTEVTVDAARRVVDLSREAREIVSIGRPVAGAMLHVLDSAMRPVPPGVTGEIYVASPGLARGYLGHAERTAVRFVPDPFGPAGGRLYRTGDLGRFDATGSLHFVGRVDKQVKIRGQRVELEEIEACLAAHSAVARCAVRLHADRAGAPALIAFVQLAGEVHGFSAQGATYRVYTLAQRPELRAAMDGLHLDAWPAFFEGDAVMKQMWPRIFDEAPQCQFAVTDESGAVVAAGNSLPFVWDGTPADLPAGWDDALTRGLTQQDRGNAPDTLLMLTGVVAPAAQGLGLSTLLLQVFQSLARGHGLSRIVVPVRPTGKDAHPNMSFEAYCELSRDDGLPVDPWLRSHLRAGGKILGYALASQPIVAPVDTWKRWTGLEFPSSGEYAMSGGLQPLRIDLDAGIGRYDDPSVWVEHQLGARIWPQIDPAALREFLRESLPAAMIPDRFVYLDRLPLTDSGKIDEPALPMSIPGAGWQRPYTPPQTQTQTRLVDIWHRVLGLEHIGIYDDFYELGGHSIHAVQMLARIADAFARTIPLRQLFQERTVAALARLLDNDSAEIK